eukprot:5625365-Prymnesium_polylepis.1
MSYESDATWVAVGPGCRHAPPPAPHVCPRAPLGRTALPTRPRTRRRVRRRRSDVREPGPSRPALSSAS